MTDLATNLVKAFTPNEKFTDQNSSKASLLILIVSFIIIIFKLVLIMIIGQMIWNNVLITMMPSLQPTTAMGMFGLWFFIRLML